MSDTGAAPNGFVGWVRSIDWTAVFGVGAVLGLLAIAVIQPFQEQLQIEQAAWRWTLAFGVLCFVAFAAAMVKAVFENRFTTNPSKPRDHISGWSFLALIAAIAAIVMLANWAAKSSDVNRVIHAQWGVLVVVGVAGAFFLAALTPSEEFVSRLSLLASPLTAAIKLLGNWLSGVDAMIVFGIAGAAGATRTQPLLRYFLLFGTLLPCALLGFSMDPPWGLAPIAWGSLVAVAMSRAWAWVEEDRDLAMLSGKYTGDHLRIGFAQDLRDEALFSFMALFFLVPLALRQCQLAADLAHMPLFAIRDGVPHDDLGQWIAYYGTELAKAVPFVDWAEVYHVEGDALIAPSDEGFSRHLVFATRVLVDLVLLAALLQALALAARNSKQRELFARGDINILDPFTEPTAFRRLRRRVAGRWEADEAKVADFPKYSPQRLVELSDEDAHPDIACVAIALQKEQGVFDIDRSEEFHKALLDRAQAKRRDPAAIDAALSAIQIAKASLNIPVLAEVRRLLNSTPAMNGVRERLMRMIESAAPSAQRDVALREALDGATRDTIAPVREAAMRGLDDALQAGALWARDLALKASASEAHRVKTAAELLVQRFKLKGGA